MKRATIWFMGFSLFIVALGFSVYYSYQVYQGHKIISGIYQQDVAGPAPYRIVVIGEEIGNPFWSIFKQGAFPVAEQHGVDLEFWGTLRPNSEEMIKNMEIAIASNVDGIIVQAVAHPDFSRLILLKASAAGIPVITAASDMPAGPEALRKTYVGSDHFQEGVRMGEHVAAQMNGYGKLGIIMGRTNVSNQALRLEGLRQVLEQYPEFEVIENRPEELDAEQDVMAGIRALLNEHPDCKVFIGLSSESGEKIVEAIKRRARIEPYGIYFFDDNMETVSLVRDGTADGAVIQNPEEMGRKSVELMLRWLEGVHIPLPDVYHTPFELITDGEAM
ncbi:sugar ABC transporter substrate-binding protein [Xylanibacillus composti]|uniref:Sugar ABC transporter substrate-binding protein n=1 Tax=Xylanibacillus composti TaxID=1572762 RepID=A0A8J4M4J8_9BACL|nr:substrate-binding domain-containing protein [Xylanibacillus composti]GIQ71332.1 sugar ABC transporter substrate-binding protein [Xylanibacillus composti]